MFKKIVPCYIFQLTFLKLITVTHLTFHDSSHGFITKNARYFEDEISHFHEEIGSMRYLHKLDTLGHLNIRFEPEFLNFGERALGVPHTEIVTLYNTDNNKTIDLTSISGNTVHFHSSFFEDKKIPPNGNTSFKIVYLGRQEGPVESSLFVHTSSGSIKYNVKAYGAFSNYRVRPIVGVKLPVNSTFTPVIYMHNPHSEPIQIVEIYSSGGGFHLELPSGQHEGSHELWEIYPQETKAIIRVRFEGKIIQNHTAYIRIKLHNPDEILIVPLEVEVTSTQNIFQPQGHVDFGIGGSMDVPKEINLCVFNPLRKPVRIHSVSTLSKSIKTQYYNIKVNPGNEVENQCVSIGTLTVDWKHAYKSKDFYGKIIVKFRNGKNRTEIPYYITVIKGGLSYDKTATTYFLNDKNMDTEERNFEVLNEFLHPIKVLDVRFPHDVDSTFKIENFTPLIIKPLQKESIFNFVIKKSATNTNVQVTSYIKLITNVTELQIPLLSYNGKVQIHLPFISKENSLNVGLIGYLTTKEIYFTLTNPNPIDLPLLSVQNEIPMVDLAIQGCGTGDHKSVLLLNSFSNLTRCDKITSNGFAIIKLTITSNDVVGEIKENIKIQTPFENVSIPVQFKVSPGSFSLASEELIFEDCFPTKTCVHLLRVHSTFQETMLVEKVLALPENKNVNASITGMILPNVDIVIGQMRFTPDRECGAECYAGFLNEGSAMWLSTMVITKHVIEYDLQLLKMFYGRFLNFTGNGSKSISNISLRLDTSEIKGHFFQSKVNYIWPSLIPQNSLVSNCTLTFPLTQVGNVSFQNLHIYNPSSHNIIIQLLLDWDYPHVDMLYDGVPSSFMSLADFKHSHEGFFFDKKVQERQRVEFRDSMRVSIHQQSMAFLLKPGETKKIRLGFAADEAKTYSSLLILRNNLTIVEFVRLKGKGSVPHFKFGGRRPGAVQPLLFEMNEKNLKDCVIDEPFFLYNLTIKRSFTARNLGDIPVHIYNFFINGYQCEGFGFKVLNCEPFTLLPNASKRIDIGFTSDLTLSKVSRTLILSTSLNIFVNYSLYATIPYAYCTACDKKIERPHWEILMSYMTNIFMIAMFFVIMYIAILDADAIKRQAWATFLSSSNPPILPVLDLKKIGKQVKEEMQFKEKKKMEPEVVNEICEIEQEIIRNEPAIVPTTGKAKRKLAQRNSLNEDEPNFEDGSQHDSTERERTRERQTKKDILFETHRLKSKERRTEKELKLLEEKERKEKHAQQKEMEVKQVRTILNKKGSKAVQEEEASSTTTESSNSSGNGDEVDKENRGTKNWLKKRIEPLQEKSSNNKETLPNQAEHKGKHVSFVNSKLKAKSKTPDKLHEHEGAADKGFCHNSFRDLKRRNDKKDRKDKSTYRSKNGSERRVITSESDSTSEKESSKSPNNFFIPFPPQTTSSQLWSETRAKFSDVVARNEPQQEATTVSGSDSSRKDRDLITAAEDFSYLQNSTHLKVPNRPTSEVLGPLNQPNKSMKPTMYVEPYKPIDHGPASYKPVDHGPIGSKRSGLQGRDDSPDAFMREHHDLYSPTKNNSSALTSNNCIHFSPINDRSVIAAISNNTLLANDTSFFSQQQGMRLDGNDNGNIFKGVPSLALWNQQQQQHFFSNAQEPEQRPIEPDKTSSFLSEPVDESWNRATLPSSHDYWSTSFSHVLESSSKLTSNTSYLWGSNSVWQPWSPAANATRRTPPGFDEQIQKRRRTEEELRRLQQRDYSPFSSGYPWTQQNEPN